MDRENRNPTIAIKGDSSFTEPLKLVFGANISFSLSPCFRNIIYFVGELPRIDTGLM